MILLIDNYDSFTYNLFQQISMLGKNVKVVRNDAITIEEIQKMSPEAIILSPDLEHQPKQVSRLVLLRSYIKNFLY